MLNVRSVGLPLRPQCSTRCIAYRLRRFANASATANRVWLRADRSALLRDGPASLPAQRIA